MYGKETSTNTCLQILTDLSVVGVCLVGKLGHMISTCVNEYLVALKHWILRVLLLFPQETRDLTSL